MVPFSFAGQSFAASLDGALYWPRHNALLVADLHLEKASWFARLGQMLPPYDSLATLQSVERQVEASGATALYCLGDSFHDRFGCDRLPDDVLTLVTLPKLDYSQAKAAWFNALDAAGVTLRVETLTRHALPAWLAQRLARQNQRVRDGEEGQRTLAFFADRIEGNLLAAHQELQKLALLHETGELSFEQVESAVLNVARYDVAKLSDAIWAGQTARALRVLDGLQAEGEAAVRVHWTLAEDIRAVARAHAALQGGKPLPMAIKSAGVWGQKEKMLERVLPLFAGHQVASLLDAASICDGIAKGLKHPDWPHEPWAALRRWVLAMLEVSAAKGRIAPRLALRA